MTGREILLNSINHKGNDGNIAPYVLGFDCPVLEKKVNEHYGVNWHSKICRFIDYPLFVSMAPEEPIPGKKYYKKDIFGSVIRTDKRPWHLEKPALSKPSFQGYDFPSINDFIEPLEKTDLKKHAKNQNEQNQNLFRIINVSRGIYDLTWRIRGFEETMCDIATEEEFYGELVERITDLFVGMAEYLADVEADAFFFADDWGYQQGIIIGPEKWRRFIKPAWKRVYDKCHAQGKYVISHCCGSIYDIIPDAIEIGLDMFESVQPEAYGMNPFKLKEEFGDKMGFWGTLGSQSVIPFWKPSEIKEHIYKLKKAMNANGGYILAPAKSFQPETPLENAVAVIDAVTEMN